MRKTQLTGLGKLLTRFNARFRKSREAEIKLAEKNEMLQNLRRQVARKDRELARLQKELAQTSGSPSDSSVPTFFIMGRARSGTTWLRSLLNAHPEIMCWGEGRFFERSFERKDYKEWQLKNIAPVSLYGALLKAEHLRAWMDRSVWASGKDVEEHLDNLTRLAVEYFLTEQLSQTGARIVGDKTPYVRAEVFEEIGSILPDAKVIHIIRDGRDAAVSAMHLMWSHPKSEGGVWDLEAEELEKRAAYRNGTLIAPAESLFTESRLASLATEWSSEVGKAVEDGPTFLKNNYAAVYYEDLLERPVEEMQRLLRFLGASSGRKRVERCVEAVQFERKTSRKRGEEDSTSRFRKGISGDWKNVFTERDKSIYKEVAGDLLVQLGYEKDYSW